MIDWDEWRQQYQALDFHGQAAFYVEVAREYPEQTHWDLNACVGFYERLRPARIVEIGGWDGALAAEMLSRHPEIESWDNHEIVAVPQACQDSRYRRHLLDDWFWLDPPPGDALVTSHTVEHLSNEHLRDLLDASGGYRALFVATPLPDATRPRWGGYHGSHILDLSWDELDAEIQARGWFPEGRWGCARWYSQTPHG